MNKIKTLQSAVNYVEKSMILTETQKNDIIDNSRKIVKDYAFQNNLKSLEIGISGGLDSAVVAALYQLEFTGVPLIGISIPMSSSNEHREQAEWVGNEYCTVFEEFNGWSESIGMVRDWVENNIYKSIFSVMQQTDRIMEKAGFDVSKFPTNILQGNSKARIRMMTLYDMANKGSGMVLSTDNYSEYLAGFWTINGDVGDWGPIQNIWKGFELPQIARALGIREDIITQKPSDGLMVTEDNTDEAQLGMNYKEFDTIMSIYLKKLNVSEEESQSLYDDIFSFEKDSEDAIKVEKAITRYENSMFKRKGTINLTREELGIK